MVIDRLTKVLLGVLAAAALAIGGISMYLTFAPQSVDSATVEVEMGAACNAYIEGDRPWCAQIFKVSGAYALGLDLED